MFLFSGHRQQLGGGHLFARQKLRIVEEFFKHLSFSRNMFALPLIGKYSLIVDDYLENAVMSFNQFAVDAEMLLD
jgi:hypothetical protein